MVHPQEKLQRTMDGNDRTSPGGKFVMKNDLKSLKTTVSRLLFVLRNFSVTTRPFRTIIIFAASFPTFTAHKKQKPNAERLKFQPDSNYTSVRHSSKSDFIFLQVLNTRTRKARSGKSNKREDITKKQTCLTRLCVRPSPHQMNLQDTTGHVGRTCECVCLLKKVVWRNRFPIKITRARLVGNHLAQLDATEMLLRMWRN